MSTHSFVRLGSWRIRVRSEDFRSGGVVLRLPYDDSQSITVGERVRAYAKLRVNLHVAGQGGFSTQEPDVRLRPFDSLGDERFHFGPGSFSPSP